MEEKFRCYVYAYLREDGTPYYIGKGTGDRATKKHIKISRPKDRSRIVILEKNLSHVGAFALERFYIRWYGRKDIGTGILRNRTDGGEGVLGRPKTEAEKQRLREVNLGKKWTEEQKEKARLARIDRGYTPKPKRPKTIFCVSCGKEHTAQNYYKLHDDGKCEVKLRRIESEDRHNKEKQMKRLEKYVNRMCATSKSISTLEDQINILSQDELTELFKKIKNKMKAEKMSVPRDRCFGEDNSFYGRKHSEETKARIGQRHYKSIKFIVNGDQIFHSEREVCEKFGLGRGVVSRMAKAGKTSPEKGIFSLEYDDSALKDVAQANEPHHPKDKV